MIHLPHLFKSFKHALRGVRVVFVSEQSFRIQVFAGIIVLIVAGVVHVRSSEWIILFLLIGSVLTLELINSIFERIMDSFKPRIHPMIKDGKDIMAGAVLLVSFISLMVGLVIFTPHLVDLVENLTSRYT